MLLHLNPYINIQIELTKPNHPSFYLTYESLKHAHMTKPSFQAPLITKMDIENLKELERDHNLILIISWSTSHDFLNAKASLGRSTNCRLR